MTSASLSMTALLVYFSFIILGLTGWVLNLIQFFMLTWDTASTECWVRLIGIPVAIIGMIYGWM